MALVVLVLHRLFDTSFHSIVNFYLLAYVYAMFPKEMQQRWLQTLQKTVRKMLQSQVPEYKKDMPLLFFDEKDN